MRVQKIDRVKLIHRRENNLKKKYICKILCLTKQYNSQSKLCLTKLPVIDILKRKTIHILMIKYNLNSSEQFLRMSKCLLNIIRTTTCSIYLTACHCTQLVLSICFVFQNTVSVSWTNSEVESSILVGRRSTKNQMRKYYAICECYESSITS